MARIRASRIYTPVLVLVVCVASAVLGFALRNGQAVIAKASPPPPQRSDEKVIERKRFAREPFQFGELSVGKVKIAPNAKFSARSLAETSGGQVDDWIENLSFTIKNISTKRMIYINVELDFPETGVGRPLMVFNQLALGIPPQTPAESRSKFEPLALEPDDKITFSFSPDRLRIAKQFLASNHFQLGDLNRMNVRIDDIVFDDGMRWAQGYDYRPNPSVPTGYEQVYPPPVK
jgi:hypothetical protein